jgi:hypothetical protein
MQFNRDGVYMMRRRSTLKLIDVDANGTPIDKLPECPECWSDELAVINRTVVCYACQSRWTDVVRVTESACEPFKEDTSG